MTDSPLWLYFASSSAFVAALVSLPWMLVAMGFEVMGDSDRFDRVIAQAPFSRWLDWIEARP